MKNSNVLVTGAAGFIGSNLIDRLLNLGNHVVGIDNFDQNYCRSVKLANIGMALSNKNFRFIEGDIGDIDVLRDCFQKQKPDVVIHLAAKSGVRHSINFPEQYYQTNVNGTINVLETMKKYGVEKLIFASSSSVYGNCKKVPFDETDSVDEPISPYAASKKAGELICYTYHHLYGFDIFCLRFFSVFGPRQRPDLAIYKFTDNIVNGKPIELYGNGNTSRDYTYIEDIIDGIINSIDRLKDYEIINLGDSNTISLKQLVATIEKNLNKSAIINWMPMQPGDVNSTFANISKAKRILDYSPKWKFDDGVREFIKWKYS